VVRDAIGGDERAFEALVGPLIAGGYQLALTMLRDREAANDALQDATFKAWRRLNQLREGRLLRPWFLSIVANECRSVRRGRWWSVVRLADRGTASDNPEDQATRTADLGSALKKLDRDERVALFLFFYLDLPLAEAAQVLGVTAPAAKSRIYRAVAKLRPRLNIQEVIP
jgi:RNA polymerase sigma-70 factor (ECF subfamily)